MIEMISTSPVQNSSARQAPQAVAVAYQAVSAAISAPQVSSVSSHIRVDNARNVAILEYRNNDGDVVRQYPSESQIEAFRRAQQIQEQVKQQIAAAPAPDKAPAPQAAAPSSAPSAPAPSAEISVSPGGGEASTTSVVV